jgi:hypothetical protein
MPTAAVIKNQGHLSDDLDFFVYMYVIKRVVAPQREY